LSAELLKKGQNNHLIIEAALAIGVLKDTTGLALVRTLTLRPEPFLRAWAATALASFGGHSVFEDLKKLSQDTHWLVRARAAEGMGNVQNPETIELLIMLFDDPDFRVRYNALAAMGKYRDRDLRPYLRPALSDHDFALVATACDIITQRKDSALFSELVESYRKDIHQTETDFKFSRLDAALALVDSGAVSKSDTRLDSLLLWALVDPDRLIRKKGIELGKSMGRDYSNRLGSFAPRFYSDSLPKYLKILRENRVSVTFSTPRGDITILLLGEKAPRTAANFLRLCESGYYDGLVFHRVVPNFVIQDGCRRGDGWGGPGYTLRCEYNDLTYGRGTVGMALSGKDTGGSQYFICHAPQPHLDGRYTIFGRVTSGLEVVDAIQIGDGTVVKKITREPVRK
jgi:cyclophilin family peptidyl-prolyl cis-trans isomerase